MYRYDEFDAAFVAERVEQFRFQVARRLKGELSDLGVDLFYWAFVEERSIEEIQELSGMSAAAVYQWRSRLARLIRKLREESLSEKAPEMRRSLQRGA